MQESGRSDKTDGVGDRVRSIRQLAPMGIPVKDRKNTDQHCGDPQRRPHIQCNEQAERNARQRDRRLGQWQVDTAQAQQSAERHHQWKGDRQDPDRRIAKLSTPQADRNHGDEMIEPGDWMEKTASQPNRDARAGVGERGGQRQERKQRRKRETRQR